MSRVGKARLARYRHSAWPVPRKQNFRKTSMPLQIGAQAPDVSLISHSNEPVSLSNYRGEKPVVLLFFPLAFTSACTAQLCAVRDDFKSYEELDAEVFAVSVDSSYTLKQYREQIGASYTFQSRGSGSVRRASTCTDWSWVPAYDRALGLCN